MSDNEATTPLPPIHLDGTNLEGGGQLLRLALSLSSLTHIPIHVTDIRGKRGPRSSPGKDGGLKPAHLAGVQWLARATGAKTKGMEAKSKELEFKPNGSGLGLGVKSSPGEQPAEPERNEDPCVWRDINRNGKVCRRDAHISMATPGAITLVLQALLPYLLFSNASFVKDEVKAVPLRITIEGGTNVGSVTFDINPLTPGYTVPAFRFQNKGELIKVYGSIIAPGAIARGTIREKVIAQLLAYHPGMEILFPVDEDSHSEKRLYLLLVAETSNGYRFGRDWSEFRGSTVQDKCERLVTKVVKDLKRELKHGGGVDEYMQDQLVAFQVLASGTAEVDGGKDREPTLHTKTARWVAEKVLGVRFDDRGSCEGVGFISGEDFRKRRAEE